MAHVSDVLCVEVRHVKALQVEAIREHETHVGYFLCIEVRHVKTRQISAIREHIDHIGNVLSVEVRHVKARQAAATREHAITMVITVPAHVGYILRVEVRHVKARQLAATREHAAHVSYILCMEIVDGCDSSKVVASTEPIGSAGNRSTICKCISAQSDYFFTDSNIFKI